MRTFNQFQFYQKELSKLLKQSGLVSFYDNEKIIARIINLLTEDKVVHKILGLITTSEISTYGGDISEEESKRVYEIIIEWWLKKSTPYNKP